MSEADKQMILSSVWCSHCRQGTTITDYSCTSKSNSLILEGKCQVCGENGEAVGRFVWELNVIFNRNSQMLGLLVFYHQL